MESLRLTYSSILAVFYRGLIEMLINLMLRLNKYQGFEFYTRANSITVYKSLRVQIYLAQFCYYT